MFLVALAQAQLFLQKLRETERELPTELPVDQPAEPQVGLLGTQRGGSFN